MEYFLAPLTGVIGIIFAIILWIRISNIYPGNTRMQEIAAAIHEGAMAFISREYRTLSIFAFVLFCIGFFINWKTAICFIVGAVFSVLPVMPE